MALNKAQIVDDLSNATVIEIADLVKELENKWGVTAAAPVAVAAAAPAAEAKTTFDVILASVPADKKIAVIKAVREVKAGLGLAEAKALVEGAPKPVLEGASKADADAAKGADKEVLQTIATSPFVFPTPDFAEKLHNYRVLEGDEVQTWNDIFNPIFLT